MSGPEVRLKLLKCWEGDGPFLVLHVSAFGGGQTKKFYVTVDANQKTRGLRPGAEKRADLKVNGGVVAQLRKHAPSGGLGGLWRHEESGDLWIPIHTRGGDHPPDAYVQLAFSMPPEIRLILADGTVLVRKSSLGTFTKKRTFEGTLPLTAAQAGFRDATPELVAPPPPEAPEEDVAAAPAGSGEALLPDHQREARARLARKLKTVRKYAQKSAGNAVLPAAIAAAERAATMLKENLYRVREGMHELAIDGVTIELDPEATPGHNLDLAFTRVKKLKRTAAVAKAELDKARAQLEELEREIARLRAAPMGPTETAAILARFKIMPLSRAVAKDGLNQPRALPYRGFEAHGVTFLVGKGAADNDTLTRAARSDDWWFHAAGLSGSHVIVPKRSLKGGLTPEVLRAGCILALFHSKARDNQRGEVYVTQRRNLRKSRGLAVGLWLVQQSETVFVTYEPDEVQRLLAATTT